MSLYVVETTWSSTSSFISVVEEASLTYCSTAPCSHLRQKVRSDYTKRSDTHPNHYFLGVKRLFLNNTRILHALVVYILIITLAMQIKVRLISKQNVVNCFSLISQDVSNKFQFGLKLIINRLQEDNLSSPNICDTPYLVSGVDLKRVFNEIWLDSFGWLDARVRYFLVLELTFVVREI